MSSYRVGGFEVQAQGRRVLRAGEPVPLGARALDLLLALIEHHDRVVGKDELLALARRLRPSLTTAEVEHSHGRRVARQIDGQPALAHVISRRCVQQFRGWRRAAG